MLVVDLQDVGTRVYTYIWTVVYCLEVCAELQLPVVILDRPNPLGGVIVEGPLLQPVQTSFVGLMPIPMRHGLTLGELARLANQELKLGRHWRSCRWTAGSGNAVSRNRLTLGGAVAEHAAS